MGKRNPEETNTTEELDQGNTIEKDNTRKAMLISKLQKNDLTEFSSFTWIKPNIMTKLHFWTMGNQVFYIFIEKELKNMLAFHQQMQKYQIAFYALQMFIPLIKTFAIEKKQLGGFS